MRKLLVGILVLFALCGCTKPVEIVDDLPDTYDMVCPDEFAEDYFAQINVEEQEMLYDSIGYIEPKVLWMLGMQVPDIELETYDGKSLNLSSMKGQMYVIELMAPWCSHCHDAAAGTVEELKKILPKMRYVQCILDQESTKEEIEEFYAEIEMEVPKDQHICYYSEELVNFVKRMGLGAIPTFIFVDETGRIAYVNIGSRPDDEMAAIVNFVKKQTPIYKMKMEDGKTLFETLHQ